MRWAALGIESLRANLTRSLLTTFGIVVGTGAVIVMVGLGEGVRREVVGQLRALGENQILVRPALPAATADGQFALSTRIGALTSSLDTGDVEAIRREAADVVAAAPELQYQTAVARAGRHAGVTVVGTEPDYARIFGLLPLHGRFLTDADVSEERDVCVLGYEAARALDPEASDEDLADLVGARVEVGGVPMTVAGVLAPRGVLLFFDYDQRVYVPVGVAQRETFTASVHVLHAEARAGARGAALEQIEAVLAERHPSRDFALVEQTGLIRLVNRVMSGLTLLVAAIAGLSLLVGGVGIMNTMLVAVAERTREVGLRKAVGARDRDILWQFLAESAVMAMAGGALGVVGGAATLRLASGLAGDVPFAVPWWAALLAVAFTGGVGLVFGVTPARRAARLDPVRALRWE